MTERQSPSPPFHRNRLFPQAPFSSIDIAIASVAQLSPRLAFPWISCVGNFDYHVHCLICTLVPLMLMAICTLLGCAAQRREGLHGPEAADRFSVEHDGSDNEHYADERESTNAHPVVLSVEPDTGEPYELNLDICGWMTEDDPHFDAHETLSNPEDEQTGIESSPPSAVRASTPSPTRQVTRWRSVSEIVLLEKLKTTKSTTFYGSALLVVFVFLPSASTSLFRLFECMSITENAYLVADLSIDCAGPTHRAMEIYGYFMIAIYPIGMPALFFVLLSRVQERINPPNADIEAEALELRSFDLGIAHLRPIFEMYRPTYWWFEVVDLYRRILLMGFCVWIPSPAVRKRGTPRPARRREI